MRLMAQYHKVLALLLFGFISILYFGLGLINHLNSALSGSSADVYAAVWSFAWWPHALMEHLNPFIAKVVWTTEGINVTKINMMPGFAYLFMPITVLFGAATSYNLGAIFSSAFGAWSAYLLAFYILKSRRYALLAGYLFGYSSYVIAQLLGHLVLVAPIFLIPLFPLLLLYWLDHKISFARATVLLTLCLVGLFSISTEIFMTLTFWGAVCYLLALYFFQEQRQSLCEFIKVIALSYLFTAIIVSPYLYFFFTDSLMAFFSNDPATFSNDLLGFFIPDSLFLLSTKGTMLLSSQFAGNSAEWNSYLGLGVCLILFLFIRDYWKTNYGRYLTLIIFILAIASLGPFLHIAGVAIGKLPWRALFLKMPVLKLALPGRLGLFTSLPIAIAVAFWLKNCQWRPLYKIVLACAAIAFLLPSFSQKLRPTILDYPKVEFFDSGLYKDYLNQHDNLLILPYHNPQVFWQVTTNFAFNLAGGYLGAPPALYQNDELFHAISLEADPPPNLTRKKLADFIALHKITKIIITDTKMDAWKPWFKKIDAHPQDVGGVTLYKVPVEDTN